MRPGESPWTMALSGADHYDYSLEVPAPGLYALFTEHMPEEFDAVFLDAQGGALEISAEHVFNPEHASQDWTVDAPLTGVAVDRGGRTAACAGGDGTVRLAALDDDSADLATHNLTDGAVLAITADCRDGAFLAGADDGSVFRIDAAGHDVITRLDQSWPDQLASHSAGIRAVADGPVVRLLDPPGPPVAALAWSPDGRCLVGGNQDGRLFVYRFDNDWLARLNDEE